MVGHDGHGSVVLDLLQTNTASNGSHTRAEESFESQRVAKQPRVQEPALYEGGLERLVMRMHGTHTVAKWSARYHQDVDESRMWLALMRDVACGHS